MRTSWSIFWIFLPFFTATIAWSATPEQRMNDLYGERLQAANTNPKKVELAREMLADAGQLAADPGVQLLLYRKSYELGVSDPSGYPAARRAAALLLKADPMLKGEAEEKLIAVAEKDFRAAPPFKREGKAAAYADQLIDAADDHASSGDPKTAIALYERAAAIPGVPRQTQALATLKAKSVRFQETSQERAKELEGRLKKNPTDRNLAATLVHVLVLDLDRPSEAEPYVSIANDALMARRVTNASRDPASLSETEALELADWYRSQAEAAHDGSQPIALRRSEGYYQRVLELHKEHDVVWLKTSRSAEDVAKSLASVAPTIQKHINLVPLIDPQRDGVAGKWQMVGEGLSCDSTAYGHLALPYHPPAEYDFHVEFSPTGGYGIDSMILTHAGHTFQWTMNRTSCYFEEIKKPTGEKPPERARMQLQDGHRYSAIVQVREGSVTASVDGKLMARYQTDFSDLSPVYGFDLPEGVLGLGAYQTSTLFYVIEVAEMPGHGKTR